MDEGNEIKTDKLISFLSEIDKELSRVIQLNAVGGTAMTLLHLKRSTIDIDFDMTMEDGEVFERVLKIIPHGFKIDRFTGGYISSQQLPDDHISKRIGIDTSFGHIQLFALHPVDIVATKIGRLNERDLQDIESCIIHGKLKKEEIEERAKQIVYCGNEKIYKDNLR